MHSRIIQAMSHARLGRRLQRMRLALLAIALAGGAATAQAPRDVRVALVIGNGAYPGSAALINPPNDAAAIAATLKRHGFEVRELRDARRTEMSDAIVRFTEAARGKQAITMVYYAGHGLQLDWRNYMVPVDAKLSTAADVPAQTVELGSVFAALKAADTRMNFIVLDACRDNPFALTASGKGLAQVDAPAGTLLAYATAPGNVAEDGDGSNGVYTGFLLQELQGAPAKIEDVFKRVRLQVRKKTHGRQIPWESTSLEEDFTFASGAFAPVRPQERERAEAFEREKAEWDRIKDSRSVDDFYAFVGTYPSGSISELAQIRIESLQKAQVVAQAGPDGKVQIPFDRRYQNGDRYEAVLRDGLTGLEIARGTIEVRALGEDLFETMAEGKLASSVRGIATRSGFSVKDPSGATFDPPWPIVPGAYQVGKRSFARSIRTDANGIKSWIEVESRVVARERIRTAFGEIDTYKVEINRLNQDGSRLKYTYWFDPDWGVGMKLVVESRSNRGGAPDILIREVIARSRKS